MQSKLGRSHGCGKAGAVIAVAMAVLLTLLAVAASVAIYPEATGTVRYESGGAVTAELFPDIEAAEREKVADVQAFLRGEIDKLNASFPQYKQIQAVKFRDVEFEKTTTKKIKRFVLNK